MERKEIDIKVKEIIRNLLEIEDEIDLGATFFQLGGQSIKASKLQIEFMSNFKIRISLKDLYKNTIGELEELIYNSVNKN